MTQHGVPGWHTAEEMQLFSNAAHIGEGSIVALVALLALAQARGYAVSGRARFAWPGLLLLAGVFLVALLLVPWHGADMAIAQWRFIFDDPQQRQHLVIGVALTLGGLAEVVYLRRHTGWLQPMFPLATLAVGIAFFMHTQHGTAASVERAVLIHRLLGGVLSASALLALAARWKPQVRWLQFAWPATLLVAALLLFIYREPSGAFH